MKFIFRLIGVLVVLIVLLSAALCYLDTKDLLTGRLDRLVGNMRVLGAQAWDELYLFLSESGIADDAASLLDQGANLLREGVTPHATEKPGSRAFAEGYFTPTPVPTATPIIVTATATPVPTATPIPVDATATPVGFNG